jgi:ribosome-associated protein
MTTTLDDPLTNNPTDTQKSAAQLSHQLPPVDELTDQLVTLLDENKAQDIVTINLEDKATIGDRMIVASGRSARQVSALSKKIDKYLSDLNLDYPIRVEGKSGGDWILIDAGSVIVHLFRPEVRDFYNLEKLWSTDDLPPADHSVVVPSKKA